MPLAHRKKKACPKAAAVLDKLAAAEHGLGFFDLANALSLDTVSLTQVLWTLSWQGRLSSDSFETVPRPRAGPDPGKVGS